MCGFCVLFSTPLARLSAPSAEGTEFIKFNHEDTKAQRRIRHDNRIYRELLDADFEEEYSHEKTQTAQKRQKKGKRISHGLHPIRKRECTFLAG